MCTKLGSSSLGPIELMDDSLDKSRGVEVIADGWREGLGGGRKESGLCVVVCVVGGGGPVVASTVSR
jgi:hypothetical protein